LLSSLSEYGVEIMGKRDQGQVPTMMRIGGWCHIIYFSATLDDIGEREPSGSEVEKVSFVLGNFGRP